MTNRTRREAGEPCPNNKRDGKVHLKPAATIAGGVVFGRPYQAPFTVR